MISGFITDNGYNPGHPWYYMLDGRPLTPRQILECVKARGYKGYRADEMAKVDKHPEPKRSHLLREMREQALADYRSDLGAYRRCVCRLRAYRWGPTDRCVSADVHTAVSLKHNHLFNDLAHLLELVRLLAQQRDLFD